MPLESVLKVLKDSNIEVSDELKGKLSESVKGLVTQEVMDNAIQKRLARQETAHNKVIDGYEEKLKDVITPDEMKKLQGEKDNLEANLKKQFDEELNALKIDSAFKDFANGENADKLKAHNVKILRQLAEDAGYFPKLDDTGKLIMTDKEGKTVIKDGKILTNDDVLKEINTANPWAFGSEKSNTLFRESGLGGERGGKDEKDSIAASIAKEKKSVSNTVAEGSKHYFNN